jgi:hypothetical protein
MTRRVRWIAGVLAAAVGAAFLTAVVAAPGPKESEPGPPMSEDQVRSAALEKDGLTWADGKYRLKAKKADGKDLVEAELTVRDGGKVRSTVTARTVRVVVDRDKATMTVFIDEAEFTTPDGPGFLRNQEFDLPAPRQGKRP